MAVTKARHSGLTGKKTPRVLTDEVLPYVDDWTRPGDWLALGTVNSGDQKISALAAIYPGNTVVAITCAGAYTVDWGDGSGTQNVATGVKAEKAIVYSGISGSTELDDGARQVVVTITPQGGSNLTSVNFNVTQTGAPSGGSSSWLDIKMAGASVATLTVSGATNRARMLQQFEFVGPSAIGSAPAFADCTALRKIVGTSWTSGCTSMAGVFSGCTGLRTVPLLDTGSATSFSTMFLNCRSLLSVPRFDTTDATTMASMFSGCSSLVSVPSFDTPSVTNFSSMFSTCGSLRRAPWLNMASATNASSMFVSCQSLEEIPLYKTSSVTNFSSFVNACRLLTSVPHWDTSSATAMNTMFQNCSSLETVPLFDTADVTTMNAMFNSCASLTSVPLFNMASVTDTGSMFNTCSSLRTVPAFNTPSLLTCGSMFSSCAALQEVPLFDTADVTDMSGMFNGCTSLRAVPLFVTTANLNFSSMFTGCSSLLVGPAFDTTAATSFISMYNNCGSLVTVGAMNMNRAGITSSAAYGNIFSTCPSLQKIDATGFKFTFSVASCRLNATELDAVYTNLATVVGQTITVTSNPGTGGDTTSIATLKGWTVTGS